MPNSERICVIGLGYVGLPVAVAFAEKFADTIGFDIDVSKVQSLQRGIDPSGELSQSEILDSCLKVTHLVRDIEAATFYVVAVPTPVNETNIPDLKPVIAASETVAKVLKRGDVVVYESTVYPGVTEEICAPILERVSGLKAFADFKIGYSPERINPGDKEHSLKRIVKVVSAQDPATLDRVAEVYGAIIEAGVHKAPSIRVAEAAKVIENTQRDLNIALMNELSIIFDHLNIRTADVLKAAATKWNFLSFKPGLVGGHCIGVDPYYLTYKAMEQGYHPQVILAGRRINDNMGNYLAQKAIKLMVKRGINVTDARVGILGLTFKENVTDIRNSKIPTIVEELEEYGIKAQVCDPMANPDQAFDEYNIQTTHEDSMKDLDLLIFAVPHRIFLLENGARVTSKVKKGGILIDVKSAISPETLPADLEYWAL